MTTTSQPKARPAGFTMVEVMFSVLVVGILLGLLIVGARAANRYVKQTADRQAVLNLAMGVKEFKRQFGFVPPLVKEQAGGGPADLSVPMRSLPGGGGASVSVNTVHNRHQVDVYDLSKLADLRVLRAEGVAFNATQPFIDDRYSIRTLAVYLVGGLNVGYNAALNNINDPNFVPIDGVTGPGFYRPQQNGMFEVPGEALNTGANASNRGVRMEPLVNLGGSALRLYTKADAGDINAKFKVALVDRNGVPIRYYRWEPGPPSSPPNILEDLNVPTIVGREAVGFPAGTPDDRDLKVNVALRGASWAVVAAGPNKYFGDEPDVEQMRVDMGLPNGSTDAEVRAAAEEDNIVEVGQ